MIRAQHNFIDLSTAERLGLPLQEMQGFEVEVADGEKVADKACYKVIKLVIQGFESYTDLLVVPLGDTK